MNKYILCVLVLFTAVHCSYGQAAAIETEKWADKPVISTLNDKYKNESAVVLMDKRRIEYIDGAKQEVEEYYTTHKIIHIIDDKGIENFNKVYLGVNENSDIVDIKARTILPGGKIVELDRSNIKDIKEDDGNTYKIFAMEGLEKGCEVEFYYTIKKPVSYFGREVLQDEFPVIKSDFLVITPERLKFDVKTYNFTVLPTDTVIGTKRIAECSVKDIAGAEEEKYASYRANLRRVEYKLSYNTDKQKDTRLFTWNELAKRAYTIYTDVSDKEKSKVQDMITANGWNKITDEVAKITTVESYAKKTFSYNEDLDADDANTLEGVLHNKVAGTIGTMRLYSTIFTALGVNYQFVLTCSREKYVIDKDFENWDNCDDPIFYFPAEHKFMAPTRPDMRYPWIVPTWAACNGLYCKQTTLGSYSTAIAEVKNIPIEDYTRSVEEIESNLVLTGGLDSLNIDTKQTYTGYSAVEFRDAFNFSNDDDRKKIIKELAKSVSSSDNLGFSEILNQGFENETNNVPLILHTKVTSDELIEKAGNNLLLKIGLAIGPQVEMYQEKPRQEPIYIEFGQIEERKLTFTIPDGYTISNPNDLNMSQTVNEDGDITFGFVSDYTIKDNLLSVHIMEQYRKTFYPISMFDQYRKVINASSDFNKVVLVLQKK